MIQQDNNPTEKALHDAVGTVKEAHDRLVTLKDKYTTLLLALHSIVSCCSLSEAQRYAKDALKEIGDK